MSSGRFHLGGGTGPYPGESAVNFAALQAAGGQTGATGVEGDVLGGQLGPRTNTVSTSAYDRIQKPGFTFSDAAKELVAQLPLVVKQGLWLSPSPFTTVIFPWVEYDGYDITWRTITFDQQMMGEVPEEGNPGLISMSEDSASASLIPRGQAFRMSKQLASTPRGAMLWVQYVQNIMGNMQMTADTDVVRAIMDCYTMEKHWSNLLRDDRASLDRLLAEEAATFGSMCLPAGSDRLKVQIDRGQELLTARGHPADSLVVASTLPVYMTDIPRDKTNFSVSGPAGPDRLIDGPTNRAMATLIGTGINVYKTNISDARPLTDASEGMVRHVRIAEYYDTGLNNGTGDYRNYKSCWNNMLIFDYDTNDFAEVTLRDLFKNSKLFENGAYASAVHRLAEAYNASAPSSGGAHHMHHDAGGTAGRFFLLARDHMNTWAPIKLFGQMEEEHLTPEQVCNIGMAAAGDMCGSDGQQKFAGMMALLTDLENAPYDATFARGIIGANIGRSAPGGFGSPWVGAATPADLARTWKTRRLSEWTPNAHGGLNLPRRGIANGTMPFGYANAPGLRTLAAESRNSESPYYELGLRAKAAIDFMDVMVKRAQTAFPSSHAVNPAKRAPWHHRPDPLAAFIPTAVSGKTGIPLFMMAPNVIEGGGVPAATDGANTDDGSMRWFSLPGLGVTVPSGTAATATSRAALVAAIRIGDAGGVTATQAVTPGSSLLVVMPSGAALSIPVEAFGTMLLETPEVTAMSYLPGGNSVAAVSVRDAYMAIVGAITTAADRIAFARSVVAIARQNPMRIWNVLVGISRTVDVGGYAAAAARLNLAVDPGATRTAIVEYESVARDALRDLVASETLGSEWRGILPPDAPDTTWSVSSQLLTDVLDAEERLLGAASTSASDGAEGRRIIADNAIGDEALTFFQRLEGGGADTIASSGIRQIRQAFGSFAVSARASAVARARAATGTASDAEQVVGDLGIDALRATYHRTPLEASEAVLRSLSDLYGGQVAKPFMIPGDKGLMYTAPLSWHGDRVDDRPGSVSFGRPMNAIDAGLNTWVHMTTEQSQHANNVADVSVNEIPAVMQETLWTTAVGGTEDYGYAADDMSMDAVSFGMPASGGGEDLDLDLDLSGLGGRSSIGDRMGGHKSSRTSYADSGSAGSSHHHDHAHAHAAGRAHTHAHAHMHNGVRAAGNAHWAPHYMGEGAVGAPATSDAKVMAGKLYSGAFTQRWRSTLLIPDPAARAAARAFLLTHADKESSWLAMITNDVPIPARMLAFRTGIRFIMESAALLRAGVETGMTAFGKLDVEQGSDTNSKVIVYNVTFNLRAVVKDPARICLIFDIKFRSYLGGLNVRFVRDAASLEMPNGAGGSIYAVATSANDCHLGTAVDFTGRTRREHGTDGASGTYWSAAYYNLVWNFSHSYHSHDAMKDQRFYSSQHVNLSVAERGDMVLVNPANNTYSIFRHGAGKLAGLVRPGGAQCLDGVDACLPDFVPASINRAC